MRYLSRTLLSAAVSVVLLAGPLSIAASAQQPGASGPAPNDIPSENLLYVCSQDAAIVSIVDMDRNVVVETVDLQALGFPANAKPHHTVVEADGSYWYLSLIGANRVVKFNRRNEVVGQAEFQAPGMLALHPTEDVLFVGRSMSAVNPPQRIGMIRRSDMAIDEIDVIYPRPHALAIHPDGRYAYTASLAENQIMTVNVETEEVEVRPVDGPTHTLVQFAFSPDGRTLVAGGQISGQLLVFDASNPPELTLRRTLDVGGQPWHPVFTPDGGYVYFGNQAANTITVVDTQDWRIAEVIEGEGIAQPHGSAVSPDGRYVYIANRNLRGEYGGDDKPGTVVVVDTETRSIERVIEVPAGASGLGTRPRPRPTH
jgi:YVTN family beta-propeller protein